MSLALRQIATVCPKWNKEKKQVLHTSQLNTDRCVWWAYWSPEDEVSPWSVCFAVLFCNRKGNHWFLNLIIQWILVENYCTEWDRMNSNLSPYLSPKRETRGVYLGCSCFQAIKHIYLYEANKTSSLTCAQKQPCHQTFIHHSSLLTSLHKDHITSFICTECWNWMQILSQFGPKY